MSDNTLAGLTLCFLPLLRRCSWRVLLPFLRASVRSVYRLPPRFPAWWPSGVPLARCSSLAALLARPRASAAHILLSSVPALLCCSVPSFLPFARFYSSPALFAKIARAPLLVGQGL